MFKKFRSRLLRYYSTRKISVDLSQFSCNIREIVDLKSMCETIAYVNRNAYVAHRNFTPYSYKWGSGYLYFNDIAQCINAIPFNRLSNIEKKDICKSRVMSLPENYVVDRGMILPISYSSYERGQSFFRDANHYFYMISKNVESYNIISKSIGDLINLTDYELYSVVYQIGINEYKVSQPTLLPPNVKIEVAKKMKYQYHASNGQIRRILKLDRAIVDELFPLSKSK